MRPNRLLPYGPTQSIAVLPTAVRRSSARTPQATSRGGWPPPASDDNILTLAAIMPETEATSHLATPVARDLSVSPANPSGQIGPLPGDELFSVLANNSRGGLNMRGVLAIVQRAMKRQKSHLVRHAARLVQKIVNAIRKNSHCGGVPAWRGEHRRALIRAASLIFASPSTGDKYNAR
jgi:hypothetical protein